MDVTAPSPPPSSETLLADGEQNRRSWNCVTPAHQSHKLDQSGFLREGGSTLFKEDIALLCSGHGHVHGGEGDNGGGGGSFDLDGLRVCHLQCNCGQDTLSLAHLGTLRRLVGVDISDVAIDEARRLSNDAGIDAEFIRSDIYDWFDGFCDPVPEADQFDLIFTSYGVIGWLGDLERWARGIKRILAPGGRFVMIEFHPLSWCFRGPDASLGDPYFSPPRFVADEGIRDYVARSGSGLIPEGMKTTENGVQDFTNPEPTVEFQFTVADLIQALSSGGLFLENMREYPYSNGCCIFSGMRQVGRRFVMPEGVPAMPLMLSIVATHR